MPYRKVILVTLALVLMGAHSVAMGQKLEPAPQGLLLYAAQPLGIDVSPRLGWFPEVAQQTAYQIRVAHAPEAFQEERQILWDSGKVLSSASAQVAYTGPELVSRMRYYWQVRVWDGQDRMSVWSEPSWWEVGLLHPTDWLAAWIGGRQNRDHNWADLRLTVDFTLYDTPLNLLFRARPIGKTYGEAYNWQDHQYR